MAKFDYKKDLKALYFPKVGQFVFVDVPVMSFLMIDGHGYPKDNPDYQAACNALYSLAYTIKFMLKPQGVEYSVPPLEGLWYMDNMADWLTSPKEAWNWTMMIMQPQVVTQEMVAQARRGVIKKKGLTNVEAVRLSPYDEGTAVQTMYLGAYSDEGATIVSMHAFIQEQGYILDGKHHEIYLGDPRRTPPEKLKTVIRQPVRKA